MSLNMRVKMALSVPKCDLCDTDYVGYTFTCVLRDTVKRLHLFYKHYSKELSPFKP